VRTAFWALVTGVAAVALAFLLLPLAALFLRVSPATLISQLGSEPALEALAVSLKTGVVAHVIILLFGTPVAYLLGTRTFRGRDLAVAGIGLLAAFGRRGLLGESFETLGFSIPFTQTAVVLAIVFVASPFYVRQAVAAFAAVDRDLLEASRTLGAGPGRTFLRVAIPLAAGGLGAGSSLAFARGLGEFGATIIFAGSFPGVTRTAPLAIYAELDRDLDVAVALGALLVLVSVSLLLVVKVLPSWTRFASTSLAPSARSASS
jgi:molybdate transport system permease protein